MVSETIETLNGYLAGVPGSVNGLAVLATTWQGISLIVLCLLLVSVLGTAAIYSMRLRHLSQHLRELSEVMQEQSRAVDSMRRTLEDAMDVLASLEAASHYPTPPGRDATVPVSIAALRQDIESLRTEILSDADLGVQSHRD